MQKKIKSVTVSPAYGREYKNEFEARADWDDNKDFIVRATFPFSFMGGGTYCSTRDFPAGVEIRIRYNYMMDVVVFKQGVKPPEAPSPSREDLIQKDLDRLKEVSSTLTLGKVLEHKNKRLEEEKGEKDES